MAAIEVAKNNKTTPSKKEKVSKFRKVANRDLGGGVMRYSHHQQYKRKALWRLKGVKKPKVVKVKKPLTKVKEIGGANNGEKRVVKIKKPRANYSTKVRVSKRPPRGCFKLHKRNVRKSLKPGRVVILLAGRQKGKRVILLKVLQSGLLLVTGPFSLNSCPLRRISQRYVIATSTRVNLSNVKIPDHINDTYFKRTGDATQNRGEGDIFAKKKVKFQPSDVRKADQLTVDKAVRTAMSKHKDKMIFKYVRSVFALSSSQYPHRLKF